MHRRTAAAVVAVAALGASAVAVAPASAAKNQITIKGGTIFKAGEFIKDNQRFVTPAKNKVKSGATVKIVNRTKDEPHTLTFIEKQFVPKSFDVNGALMGNIFTAHQVDPTNEEAPPGVFTVDDGQPLADGATWEVNSAFSDTSANGDSAFIAPGTTGPGSFKVTAAKDSTLYFFCAVHPWMSGKLKVK
jgi:plastocyanin